MSTINKIIDNGVKAKRYNGLQTVVENNLFTIDQVRSFIKKSLRLKLEASCVRNNFLIGKCWREGKEWKYYVDEKAFRDSYITQNKTN